MKPTEILRKLMKEKKVTQKDLADGAGMKYQTAVSQVLNRNDIKLSMLSRFADVLGCEVIIRDKDTGEIYTMDCEELIEKSIESNKKMAHP